MDRNKQAGKSRRHNRIDLLNGGIAEALFTLSLPIMGSQFVQMTYALFDTVWVGRLGSQSVTAVGIASSFLWIGEGIAMIPQVGGQVMTGQSIGEGDLPKARRYAKDALLLMMTEMLLYALICIAFRHPLISFFRLHDPGTSASACHYLAIMSAGCPAMGFNFAMQGLLTAAGDSKTSFIYNAAGMVLNILIDPLLIFGIGPFPALGVKGAAIATIVSESVVSAFFIRFLIRDNYLFDGISLLEKPQKKEMMQIIRIGAPPAIFNTGYAFISTLISKIIVPFGDAAVAVQRIGGQIESVTWMTAEGFAYSMSAFTSQNYGARNYDRVRKGYSTGIGMTSIYGIVFSAALVFGAAWLFGIFIREPETIAQGTVYMRIVGISQLFMGYELVTNGAFSGIGQTRLPSAVGLILTAARIPLCMVLIPVMGVSGVWWAMSASSILKGSILNILYVRRLKKLPAS